MSSATSSPEGRGREKGTEGDARGGAGFRILSSAASLLRKGTGGRRFPGGRGSPRGNGHKVGGTGQPGWSGWWVVVLGRWGFPPRVYTCIAGRRVSSGLVAAAAATASAAAAATGSVLASSGGGGGYDEGPHTNGLPRPARVMPVQPVVGSVQNQRGVRFSINAIP